MIVFSLCNVFMLLNKKIFEENFKIELNVKLDSETNFLFNVYKTSTVIIKFTTRKKWYSTYQPNFIVSDVTRIFIFIVWSEGLLWSVLGLIPLYSIVALNIKILSIAIAKQ